MPRKAAAPRGIGCSSSKSHFGACRLRRFRSWSPLSSRAGASRSPPRSRSVSPRARQRPRPSARDKGSCWGLPFLGRPQRRQCAPALRRAATLARLLGLGHRGQPLIAARISPVVHRCDVAPALVLLVRRRCPSPRWAATFRPESSDRPRGRLPDAGQDRLGVARWATRASAAPSAALT